MTKTDTMNLAIITMKDRVLLPGLATRMKISKPSLMTLLEEKVLQNQGSLPRTSQITVALVPATQSKTDPSKEEIHNVGCAARVLKVEKITEGSQANHFNVIFEGVSRVKVLNYTQTTPYMIAQVERVPEPIWVKGDPEVEALVASLKAAAEEFTQLLREFKFPSTITSQLAKYNQNFTPGQLADFLVATTDPSMAEKLKVLDAFELKPRLELSIALLKKHIQILKISSGIRSTLEGNEHRKQRELYLKQQLKSIKEELGEHGKEAEDEVDVLERKISDATLPEEISKAAQRDFKKMKATPPTQPEYTVLRNYLEWIADIPWRIFTPDTISIERARKQLDNDHFGLVKVKKRILEYLAVKKLKSDIKGPILCFLGPPGVGKTSLGKSIADALGRKFYRMSLGGVRDEAEIRGHRRTYVGALPGRIVQAMKKAGTMNPVILLDEIDKMGRDNRGDPTSALLEVLDPEQNSTFTDHYLALPMDLSKTLFIATANSLEGIPGPLLDRMELIELPGYTSEEKLQIAKSHLTPRQLKEHGIPQGEVEIPDLTLSTIISDYTREAGVRSLERNIGAVCRYVAMDFAEQKKVNLVTKDMLIDILGPQRFDEDISERLSVPGVVAGLAYTTVGGSLLFVEATKMEGSGKLILTGQLGDVMKESAQAALSWVRSNASLLGLSGDKEFPFSKTDIHIHFPAGAIPKDGPSAGVTIVTALVSLLLDKPIRPFTAMTGEIALRGLVLPVGGIKEKVLAAHRSGITRVIMPARNARDLLEVPPNVLKEVEFVMVRNIPELLKAAFLIEESWLVEPPFSHL